MKKLFFRAVCALLAFCLCSFAVLQVRADLPVDTSALPAEVDQGLGCDDAFANANAFYLNGDYAAAEGYYLLALQKIGDSALYTVGDAANNLVLTRLHLGRAEEAYALCRAMLQEWIAPTMQDQFGYMLNLLVCGHACGIPALRILHEAWAEGFFFFDELSSLAKEEPGTYVKLLVGMLYNAVYMDMEGDTALGVMDYGLFPLYDLEFLDKSDMIEELSLMLGADPDNIPGDALEALDSSLSRDDYLRFLSDILVTADSWNVDTFGESDPDIAALIDYLNALEGQET